MGPARGCTTSIGAGADQTGAGDRVRQEERQRRRYDPKRVEFLTAYQDSRMPQTYKAFVDKVARRRGALNRRSYRGGGALSVQADGLTMDEYDLARLHSDRPSREVAEQFRM